MSLGIEIWGRALATVLCSAALVALYLPIISDSISWLKARRRDSELASAGSPGNARLLFLVPAHDEATHIGDCVRSLVGMEYPLDRRRIVVIADNCTDETEAQALAAGAECLARVDPSLPGKPRAIAWALSQMTDVDEYDACVIIDADTMVRPDFAQALSSSGSLRTVAAQAYFDVLNPSESWLTTLGKVLATIRYEFAYELKSRAGLNCPLTGNGMCIGTELLKDGGWTAFSLTENWELFAQYTAQGTCIRYVPEARLLSEEASSMSGGSTQRKRWLAGRLTVLRQWLPALLRSSEIGIHQKLDAIVELSNPGPVLYGLTSVATAIGCVLLIRGSQGFMMGIAALAALGPLAFATTLSIGRQEDALSALAAFGRLPAYAVWRLLTAVATIKTWRAGRWEKTTRK